MEGRSAQTLAGMHWLACLLAVWLRSLGWLVVVVDDGEMVSLLISRTHHFIPRCTFGRWCCL